MPRDHNVVSDALRIFDAPNVELWNNSDSHFGKSIGFEIGGEINKLGEVGWIKCERLEQSIGINGNVYCICTSKFKSNISNADALADPTPLRDSAAPY